RQMFQRAGLTGCHGLGQAGSSNNRFDFAFVLVTVNDDFAVFEIPAVEDSSTDCALHVPARQIDKVGGTDFDAVNQTALKGDIHLEAVVNLLIGYMVHSCVNRSNLLRNHHKHLVNQMYAPVQHHAAAICLALSPVTGNSAETMYTGLDIED